MRWENLRDFSDNSTMHGFHELYHAKSIIWKIIWLLAITGAIGLSCYQLIKLVRGSIDEPTTTVIKPLSGDLEYPPLSICYIHWSFWVNWSLVEDLGFDKSSSLYGLSFFSDIVTTEQNFTWAEAKGKFIKIMYKNHFTKLTQFYSAISNEKPPGFVWDDNLKFDKNLDLSEHGTMCYTVSPATIAEKFHNSSMENTEIYMEYYSHYFRIDSRYMTTEQHALNLLGLMGEVIVGNDTVPTDMNEIAETKISPKIKLHNVESWILLDEGTYQIQATISSTLNVWLNNENPVCNDNKSTAIHYGYCRKYCQIYMKERLNKCIDIIGASLLDVDFIEKVCENRIISNKSNVNRKKDKNPFNVETTSKVYDSCIMEYCMMPCRDWKHTSTLTKVTVPSKFSNLPLNTRISISYPRKSSVLEMKQEYSQSWETIIGNLGGIVGLWLGASAMSVLQMVYLLCCKVYDRNWKVQKRNTMGTIPIYNQTKSCNILIRETPLENISFNPHKY